MSGPVMAAIVVPIVALPALALLIVPVMWASRDPSGKGGGHPSRRAVSGGTSRGDPPRPAPRGDAVPPEALAGEGHGNGRGG
jgi:hypothetical protein